MQGNIKEREICKLKTRKKEKIIPITNKLQFASVIHEEIKKMKRIKKKKRKATANGLDTQFGPVIWFNIAGVPWFGARFGSRFGRLAGWKRKIRLIVPMSLGWRGRR